MSVTTLTKRVVATAQPKDRAYELRDTQVRGLQLRVQPSGHKAWVVTWEHGRRRTLGSAGHLTLDEAREIARKIISGYWLTAQRGICGLQFAQKHKQIPRGARDDKLKVVRTCSNF